MPSRSNWKHGTNPLTRFSKGLAKLGPFAFTPHNLIGHPLSEVIYLVTFGFGRRLSDFLHDCTLPASHHGDGRG